RPGDRVAVVSRDVPESEGAVQGRGMLHCRAGVETDRGVAALAGGGDDGCREEPADPPAAMLRAGVHALHLADRAPPRSQGPEGDAADGLVAIEGEEDLA